MGKIALCKVITWLKNTNILKFGLHKHYVLHMMRRKQGKKGYKAVKIDFEKAYGRLRTKLIRDSILELCIPQSMVDLVMTCVSSARLQIL